MSLPICELFTERCEAANAYILVIIAHAAEQDIHMSWGEAALAAINTTPKFRRDWVNLN